MTTNKKDETVEEILYPQNSILGKRKLEGDTKKNYGEKKVEQIVKEGVVKKKQPLGKRISNIFLKEDSESVAGYILHDVLIPASKNTISDMVTGGVQMLLFGETKGSRTVRDGDRSYVPYSSFHNKPRQDARPVTRQKNSLDDDLIEFKSRGEAEEVLSQLVDFTIDYGAATVADFYHLVGITANYTDNKWGWMELQGAKVLRTRTGYILDLPRPIVLD